MFELSRILVPVAFSDNCSGALRYAVSLADRFGASVTVLHVLEPLVSSYYDSTVELNFVESCRQKWVHRELSNLVFGLGAGVSVTDICVDGDPALEIVKYAEKSDSDLIVIATHGYGPFRRFLLGSVTAKVLHDAACAVWTGAHLEMALASGPTTEHLRSVLCSVNFGPQTEAVLEWSVGMASAYGASLSLLHVIPHERDPERQRIACEQARQRLNDCLTQFPGAACEVAVGNVADETGKRARQMNADLLVIGRGHLAGGGRLRSTSYAIIRESPCPVVSV